MVRDTIEVTGAKQNNLKNVDVEIPRDKLTVVTGVSGSGKSTLIHETLYKQMEVLKRQARIVPGKHEYLLGSNEINHVINIDQSAIGRNSKSNPATYVGIYDNIRKLFASTKDTIDKGYTAIDFSLTHGNGGGELVAQGTSGEVTGAEHSYTGMFLMKELE